MESYVIEKLKNLCDLKTDQELADKIGISINTLRGWKKNNKVNANDIINFALKNNIDLNSIFDETHEGQLINSVHGGNVAYRVYGDQGNTTTQSIASSCIPTFIQDELELTYKRAVAADKEVEFNEKLEEFLYEFRKTIRS